MDGWIRRKLRCIVWVQWKRPKTRAEKLMKLGIEKARALTSAYNGRGSWWNADAPHINAAITTNRLSRQVLISLLAKYRGLGASYMNSRMPNGTNGGVRGRG
jgi:RNA-directed DNA polymerase